jgi:hypothetical protein
MALTMTPPTSLSFFGRLWMAFVCFWQVLLRPAFARAVLPVYESRHQLGAGRSLPRPLTAPTKPPEPEYDGTVSPPKVVSRRGVPTATPTASNSGMASSSAVSPGVAAAPSPSPSPAPVPAGALEISGDQRNAPALWILSAFQREGRFIDFLQDDVTAFSDADVGAAARVVHAGCRKVLTEYFAVEPVLREPEGARVTVPSGFDAARIRLTGNVAGQPPFAGALKHHGWVTRQVRFPTFSESVDPRVLAPAEVELS